MSILVDKLLIGVAREAVKTQWELSLLKKNTIDNLRWKVAGGNNRILVEILKVKRMVKPGCSQEVLKVALNSMSSLLHLNPIHAVVQLRPSLEHLKPSVSKRKNTVAADAEVTVKVEPNDGKAVGPSTKQNKRIQSSTEQKADDKEDQMFQ